MEGLELQSSFSLRLNATKGILGKVWREILFGSHSIQKLKGVVDGNYGGVQISIHLL